MWKFRLTKTFFVCRQRFLLSYGYVLVEQDERSGKGVNEPLTSLS